MRRCLALLGLLLPLLLWGAPERVHAQTPTGSKLRLGVGAVFDFAGRASPNFGGPGSFRDDGLKFTPGVRMHVDYDIHRHVSVGGFARVAWWEGKDAFYNRNALIDFGLRAAGHYSYRNLRFSLSLMLGPTISVLTDHTFGTDSPGFGVAAGVAPGVEWWFSRKAAVFTEIFGWSGHFFSHGYESGPGDLDVRMNQVLWQFGFVLGL